MIGRLGWNRFKPGVLFYLKNGSKHPSILGATGLPSIGFACIIYFQAQCWLAKTATQATKLIKPDKRPAAREVCIPTQRLTAIQLSEKTKPYRVLPSGAPLAVIAPA
jgi:hypothetical protein